MTIAILKQALIGSLLSLACSATVVADSHASTAMIDAISRLQADWAEVNYQLDGDAQINAFVELIAVADRVIAEYPKAAPAYIWRGIIQSTYAGAKGGIGALKFAKAAKADLEQSLELDPEAMNGSAYTSLGTLYLNVPGWPIGFGSNKKAEQLLLKALNLNPDGIDSNYFYASYLQSKGRDQEAKGVFLKAQGAAPRAHRPLADAGRQKEIAEALAALDPE
jgi:tetratricopeptide (TPR) repeat protein